MARHLLGNAKDTILTLQAHIDAQGKLLEESNHVVQKFRTVLPQLEALLKRLKSETVSTETLTKAGEVCFTLGMADRAGSFFEKVLIAEPDNIDALNNLGVIKYMKGALSEAELLFHRVLETDRFHPEARKNLEIVEELKAVEPAG